MIRTIIIPKNNSVSIPVPQSYVGKEVEVILFTIDEGNLTSEKKERSVSFSAASLNTSSFKFDRYEANER